jgi:hypothetical protein
MIPAMTRNLAISSIVFAVSLLSFPRALRAQTNQASPVPTMPPKILNIVRQEFIPGKAGSYSDTLQRIAAQYDSQKIPVYWLSAQSLTGPSSMLTLNFFDSFAEAQAALDAIGKAVVSNPQLGVQQEQLLTFISSETNALAVRRDDLGYRWNAIDFSKARVLRVATILVRQGHEAEFAEAIRGLRAAYARLDANSAWATYQVTAGAPSSTFVIVLPMHSLREMDDYIARIEALPQAEGPGIAERLQQIARDAYRSWDSELFIISPSGSHVPDDFAAGDPAFWRSPQR